MKNIITYCLSFLFLLGTPMGAMGALAAFQRVCHPLGESPWLFYKVEEQATKILQSGIKTHTIKEDQCSYEIPLGELPTGSKLRLRFDNQVASLRYKVEASDDQFKSELYSFSSGNKVVKPINKFTSDVDAVQSTVGFTSQFAYCYIDIPVKGKACTVRISMTECRDEAGKAMLPQLVESSTITSAPMDKKAMSSTNLDDSSWQQVGIPHCYNESDTFLNIKDAESYMWRGEAWYRKHFSLPAELYQGKRILLEFESVNVAAAVYVNGHFVSGSTYNLEQPDEVTHVGCFLPFTLDISKYMRWGEDNVITVRVSNAPDSFFVWPGFGVYSGFGMAWGGIVAPVNLHIANPVAIAQNTNSFDERWGTYISTLSAHEKEACVKVQTQIFNDSPQAAEGELRSCILDQEGTLVQEFTHAVKIPAQGSQLLDKEITLTNPKLWYPNNSPYGKPHLYTLSSKLFIDGQELDQMNSPFGVRSITWDDDYCYVNGHKHFLQGFGYRNIYPALGSAVPAMLQWMDMNYIKQSGGNVLRVGHVPATLETLKACDAYGIMLFQNSGDNEWALKGSVAHAYKTEYDRNMILSMRHHPSIIVWESNNGIARGENIYTPDLTWKQVQRYDPIQQRVVHNRDNYPKTGWDPQNRLVVGYTNRYHKVKNAPSLNTEVYGAVWNGKPSQCIYRADYDHEKQFCAWYIQDYLSNIDKKACGWIDWMLAETQGEGYTIYLNGKRNQKSLGSSAMDGNRIPKLKYRIHQKALWIGREKHPGVALQSSWDKQGQQEVDAWSNCRLVELFVGDKSYGIRAPHPRTKRCTWAGVEGNTTESLCVVGMNHPEDLAERKDFSKEVSAETKAAWGNVPEASQSWQSVCEDIRAKAGKPYAIELSLEDRFTLPNGEQMRVRSNGSDVILVTARAVDEKGHLVTSYEEAITFEVKGEGVYRGSYNFYVTPSQPASYHGPEDRELDMEGGLMKVAIRTSFKAGDIHIKASSAQLKEGQLKLTIEEP